VILNEKAPVLGSAGADPMTTVCEFGLRAEISTAVAGPGEGVTDPVIVIDWVPVYDPASVRTVIEYVVA
jgi:hypothetical protein